MIVKMVDGLNIFPIVIILLEILSNSNSHAFNVIWNAPSEYCYNKHGIDIPLSGYNILFNKNQSFVGNVMTIFYEPKPGLYPRFLTNGTAENGGIPQLVNHTDHLVQAKIDIIKTIPSMKFDGLAVIDWESWLPIFNRNEYSYQQKIYISASEGLVKKQHPNWNMTLVKNVARKQFEMSARKLMAETLQLAKALKPYGYWGYYGFPRCYNSKIGEKHCAQDTVQYNNQLCWLIALSSGLFPSIYLKESFGTLDDRRIKVKGIIQESLRLRKMCSEQKTPILAYSRFRYSDTEQLYSKMDLENTILQSYNMQLDGVVLWDSSSNFMNKTDCLNLKMYLIKILGPLVKNLTTSYT